MSLLARDSFTFMFLLLLHQSGLLAGGWPYRLPPRLAGFGWVWSLGSTVGTGGQERGEGVERRCLSDSDGVSRRS